MCLGIVMRVVSVADDTARCEYKGVRREVRLLLLGREPLRPGEYLMVHVGYAIQKISAGQAQLIRQAQGTVLGDGRPPDGA